MSHALPLVSVVIPIRGDTALLAGLLDDLPPAAGVETIVSRTGSLAPAEAALRALRPDVRWVDGPAGRGRQLNAGADAAQGQWLWFVHADCRLPAGWLDLFRQLEAAVSPVVGGSGDGAAGRGNVICCGSLRMPPVMLALPW